MNQDRIDDEVRAIIAKCLWEYNECDEHLGGLSENPSSPMGSMIRSMTIDQAEHIWSHLRVSGYLQAPKSEEGILLGTVIPILGGLMLGSGLGYIAGVIRFMWLLHG